MLRTTFPVAGAHITDHLSLHVRYNTSGYWASDFGASAEASSETNTNAIQDAIDTANGAGGGVVRIGAPGTYTIDAELNADPTPHGIYLKDNVTLHLERGVNLQAQTARGDTYAVIFAYRAAGVAVIGEGRITGDRETHVASGTQGHCIHIYHGTDVLISGVELAKANGDGFIVRGNSQNIRVERVNCHDNKRHGGAVTGGSDIVVAYCRLVDNGEEGTGGHGLDIEQAEVSNPLSSVRAVGNHADGNYDRGINVNDGTDILVALNTVKANGTGLSVTNTSDWLLAHNTSRGNTGGGVIIQTNSQYGQVVHNHIVGNGSGIVLDETIDETVLVADNISY